MEELEHLEKASKSIHEPMLVVFRYSALHSQNRDDCQSYFMFMPSF